MTTKIYVYCLKAWEGKSEDVIGYALAEDGTCLASHLSSNSAFSQHDMGITSNWKHEYYAKHCPDGFELEWVDEPEQHAGVMAAYELNKMRMVDGRKF